MVLVQLFFYDLETTHLDWYRGGIHQFAGLIEVDGKIVERFNFKIKPFLQDEIDPKSLEIGKVTEKQIMAYAKPQEVFTLLGFIMAKHRKDHKRYQAIGFNNYRFDDNFLRRFFLKNDYEYNDFFYNVGQDVMALTAFAFGEEREDIYSLSLKNVARYLGIKANGSLHDAECDVDLTYQIYKKIKGE